MKDLLELLVQNWTEVVFSLIAAVIFVFAVTYWFKTEKGVDNLKRNLIPVLLIVFIFLILFIFFPETRDIKNFIYAIFTILFVLGLLYYGIKSDRRTYNYTRIIAFVGIMAALSYLLMFIGFPIIPPLPYLKVEFSVVVMLVAFMWFNLKTAVFISLVTNIIDFLIKGSQTPFPIDQGANFLATITLLIAFSVLFKNDLRNITSKEYIKGSIISVLAVTVVMLVLNYFVILPVYYYYLNISLPDDSVRFLLATFGTFNLIKWGSVVIVFYFVRTRIKDIAFEEK